MRCRDNGLVFVAMACHSVGGWSEVAVEQIDKIIQVMAATRGEEPAELSLHTFQRLGIALQSPDI